MRSQIAIRQNFNTARPVVKTACSLASLRNGVLIRVPSALADAVMVIPALAALKNALPAECGLFVLTPQENARLFLALDFVDDVIALENPGRFMSKDEIHQVRQLRIGTAILFESSLREILSLKAARIPVLYGNSSWLGKNKITFDKESVKCHRIMRNLAIAEAFGGKAATELMPKFHIPCRADELPGTVSSLFYHRLLLTVIPGKSHAPEHYVKAAHYWIRRGGVIALCGNPESREICDKIRRALPARKTFDLCGKNDFYAMMHLFGYSALTISGDAGFMHLASAMGCPGLAFIESSEESEPFSDNWLLLATATKNPGRISPAGGIKVLKSQAEHLKLPLEKYHHI